MKPPMRLEKMMRKVSTMGWKAMSGLATKHLGRRSQRKICDKNATFYPIVLTNGLEIEFYPILTLKLAL